MRLQEIQASQTILDTLLDHDFGAKRSAFYNVSKWLSFWKKKYDLWRLKFWELEGSGDTFRIVYAYHIKERRFYILGIAHRDFNYDPSHPFTKRIVATYNALIK